MSQYKPKTNLVNLMKELTFMLTEVQSRPLFNAYGEGTAKSVGLIIFKDSQTTRPHLYEDVMHYVNDIGSQFKQRGWAECFITQVPNAVAVRVLFSSEPPASE